MKRNQLYNKAKFLASELGENTQELRSLWKKSTSEFWKNQIKKYKKQIRSRDRIYNKVLKLSKKNQEPLSIQNVLSGTNRKTWIKEYKRLKKIDKFFLLYQ